LKFIPEERFIIYCCCCCYCYYFASFGQRL